MSIRDAGPSVPDDEDKPPSWAKVAGAAAATYAALAVVGLHFLVWVFLALSGSGDNGPTRTCPCPLDVTPWTFLFYTPEAVLLAGLLAVIAVRRHRTTIMLVAEFVALVMVGVVAGAYGSDLRRLWSLPLFFF